MNPAKRADTSPPAIRDSDVAAPLKRRRARGSAAEIHRAIRDSDVAAPLKQLRRGEEGRREGPIRDSDVAAPLKRQIARRVNVLVPTDPRQRCRGPIEAGDGVEAVQALLERSATAMSRPH